MLWLLTELTDGQNRASLETVIMTKTIITPASVYLIFILCQALWKLLLGLSHLLFTTTYEDWHCFTVKKTEAQRERGQIPSHTANMKRKSWDRHSGKHQNPNSRPPSGIGVWHGVVHSRRGSARAESSEKESEWAAVGSDYWEDTPRGWKGQRASDDAFQMVGIRVLIQDLRTEEKKTWDAFIHLSFQ